MKNNINIVGNKQTFQYVIEYSRSNISISGNNFYWCKDTNNIKLYEDAIMYYRDKNDWYSIDKLNKVKETTCIPNNVNMSNIKIHIPSHSVDTYVKGVKYVLSVNTWINGKKVDLGSQIFNINDTIANPDGPMRNGNIEYHEFIDFNFIDPYYLIYSDDWTDFRHNVCGEPLYMNTTASPLYVSLYVINEYDNRYMIMDGWISGFTCFNICDTANENLSLELSINTDPLGFSFETILNSQYDNFLNYLYETYNISNISSKQIKYRLLIKSKDTIIFGQSMDYNSSERLGRLKQVMEWRYIPDDGTIKLFFSDWNAYEEGWNLIGLLSIFDEYDEEILSIKSNEIPISQNIYSMFVNEPTEYVDISNINITEYNVVNKIKNETVVIERPNVSRIEDDIYKILKKDNIDKIFIHKNIVTPLLKIN